MTPHQMLRIILMSLLLWAFIIGGCVALTGCAVAYGNGAIACVNIDSRSAIGGKHDPQDTPRLCGTLSTRETPLEAELEGASFKAVGSDRVF